MSNDKKCCILCTCLPSANRHVLRQRAPSSIFSAEPEPLPPTWQTCKVSSFTRRLLPAAGCRRRDCLCRCLCPPSAACCHSLWLPLALKLRTFAKLNGSSARRQASRAESLSGKGGLCHVVVAFCLCRIENCADFARHLIVGIIVRTNQINSSDFLTFVYPDLCVCVCLCVACFLVFDFSKSVQKIIQACNIYKYIIYKTCP